MVKFSLFWPEKEERWSILALAAYDFWLLAFSLRGYFFPEEGGFPYFVLPHVVTLFGIALAGHRLPFSALSLWWGSSTALWTALYPFRPAWAPIFLALSGCSSAFLLVRIGGLLRFSPDPVRAVALGLVLGNIFLALSLLLPLSREVLFPLTGVLLLSHLPASYSPSLKAPLKGLVPYLPLIFLFYFFIGSLYVCLLPSYLRAVSLQGVELLFYMGAVLAAWGLLRKESSYPFVLGVGLGSVSLALFRGWDPLVLGLSMFALQAAAGMMDLFSLSLFLREEDVLRGFALGAGTMLLGPAVGFSLFGPSGNLLALAVVGNILLVLSLVAFFLTRARGRERTSPAEAASCSDSEEQKEALLEPEFSVEGLSPREREVLSLILKGLSVRETAQALELSEPTVKTYLRRIYRKLGVRSKEELLRKFQRGEGDPPSPRRLKLKLGKTSSAGAQAPRDQRGGEAPPRAPEPGPR